MPAEWEAHDCCWMAWPCRPLPAWDLDEARRATVSIAAAVARFEPVRLIVSPDLVTEARKLLTETCDPTTWPVTLVPLPIDDSWARDTAPTFVLGGRHRLVGIDWRFNAYGGIYREYAQTARMARRVCSLTGARYLVAGLTLEGGALHVDGQGTVLTTEEVVLDPCRNPGLERAEAERLLCDCLGARKVIWLTGRLDADNTGGHVDNLACFAGPATVVALAEEDPADSQYGCLQENLERLRTARDARGRRLQVIPVRQPLRRERVGRVLSPSYINFYIANGGIVMPVFGDAMDEPAVATIGATFPSRQVLTVDGWPLARSDGGVHCVTQQQPRLCVAGS